MTTLLTYLRRRPWLIPSLLLIFIGVPTVISNRFPYLGFWAGALLIFGGLLAVLTCEAGYRKQRSK
jgi:hypothetical protein